MSHPRLVSRIPKAEEQVVRAGWSKGMDEHKSRNSLVTFLVNVDRIPTESAGHEVEADFYSEPEIVVAEVEAGMVLAAAAAVAAVVVEREVDYRIASFHRIVERLDTPQPAADHKA